MNDLMGVFGNGGDNGFGSSSSAGFGGAQMDMMNGFAGMDLTGGSQTSTQPVQVQTQAKNTNEDILGLF